MIGPHLAIALALLVPPTDWPRFRGPGGRGLAPDELALPARLDGEHELWSQPLGAGHSSPCVAGQHVYVTEANTGELATVALARADGRVVWRRSLEVPELERHHDVNSPASATPTSDGERVFVAFGSVGLLAYDAGGRELWRREHERARNTFGSAASPILVDDRLIWVRDTEGDSYIVAIDPESGETLWRRERPDLGSAWSTPGLRSTASGAELLVYGYGQLSAYGLIDGLERWSVPGLADEPIVVPTTSADLVFVSSYNMRTNPEVEGLPTFDELLAAHDADDDGRLDREEAADNQSVLSRYDADGEGDHPLSIFFRFLDADDDGWIERDEWPKLASWLGSFEHANALVAIRPAAGSDPEIAWQHPRGVPECPSPLVVDGRVYLVKNGGMVTCLDAQTGALQYEERSGARGPHYASPVYGDGKIYSASARGVVTVFASGDELKVLQRNDLGERILATPALVGGVVYLRTAARLVAFGSGH